MALWRKWFACFFKSFWKVSFLLVFLSIAVSIFLSYGLMQSLFSDRSSQKPPGTHSVLVLDIEGIILESQKFLKTLRKHIDQDSVKAAIIRVNSPGGAVGPSQAIYSDLIKIRKEFKKPIIMSLGAVAASGAYYIAAGGDQIVTHPGTIMGSIGVIMDFANLEDLYKWAKIKRFSVKTGKYKDTGADYRQMSPEEREYIQNLLDEVLGQFKTAIVEGRKLDANLVDQNADGRIFTGAKGVELGFADQLGGFSDAIDLAEELTGQERLKIFIPEEGPTILRWFNQLEGLLTQKHALSFLFYPSTPMYLMPSF